MQLIIQHRPLYFFFKESLTTDHIWTAVPWVSRDTYPWVASVFLFSVWAREHVFPMIYMVSQKESHHFVVNIYPRTHACHVRDDLYPNAVKEQDVPIRVKTSDQRSI